MKLTSVEQQAVRKAVGSNFTVTNVEHIHGEKVVSISDYDKTGTVAIKPDGTVEVITALQAYVGPYSQEKDLG